MTKVTARKGDRKSVSCPVETTIAAIGGRWKVLVIHHLLESKQRFGELTRLLGGVSARTLTRQLRELEERGIREPRDRPAGRPNRQNPNCVVTLVASLDHRRAF